jgi:hypothetical protein
MNAKQESFEASVIAQQQDLIQESDGCIVFLSEQFGIEFKLLNVSRMMMMMMMSKRCTESKH